MGRRLADAPLGSPVLATRPVARTEARILARAQDRAAARWGTSNCPALQQSWTPITGRDGKVHLTARWQTQP